VLAHAGEGTRNSFEWAVSAAATIGNRFLDEGYSVEMYDAEGSLHLTKGTAEHVDATRQAMLHRLTDITQQRVSTLHFGLSAMTIDSTGQVVVAITGRLSAADATALTGVRRFRTQGLAMLLDVDSFVHEGLPRTEDDIAVQILREDNWRVIRVPRGLDVGAAWTMMDQATVTV